MISPIRLWELFAMALAALCIVAMPGQAHAQSCSATITDVDFGSPNLMSTAPTDAIATVTVTCTGIPLFTTVKMCPSISDGSGGSSGSGRLLRGPGNAALAYQLFQDASRTQAWGALDNSELGTVPPLTIGTGFGGSATTTARLYARLFGSQSMVPAGTYISDYTGVETAFRYATYFIGSSVGCTGFVGNYVIRPEFEVTARPPAGCTVTATDLVFPPTGVLGTSIRGDASISVVCASKTIYSVSLDNGATGTSPTARRLTAAGGGNITYGLYRDSARSIPWGTSGAGLAASGTGTGSQQVLAVYGLVPAQNTPAPGTYSDRVVVTVSY